jgi:GntR family transcriptional regulator
MRVHLRNLSLSEQVLEILVERIRGGEYPPDTQLPTEHDLATEFGVSRATIRSAVGVLASRGLVVRRQGVGTFVSRMPIVSNPLNEFVPFLDLIASYGLEADYRQVYAAEMEASSEVAGKLDIAPGSKVLYVRKMFTADGTPVIYCINHVPAWVYGEVFTSLEAVQPPGITEPIFDFLEQQCGQRIERYVASVRAEIVQKCDMHDFPLPYDPLEPILIIDEIGYNSDGRPVHHSIEYHPSSSGMTFDLIRNRRLLPA